MLVHGHIVSYSAFNKTAKSTKYDRGYRNLSLRSFHFASTVYFVDIFSKFRKFYKFGIVC